MGLGCLLEGKRRVMGLAVPAGWCADGGSWAVTHGENSTLLPDR